MPTTIEQIFSNAAGYIGIVVIVGTYTDAAGVTHGFVRNEDGKMTTIDVNVLGAAGTFAEQINNLGVISGFYYDANFLAHGFLRTPDGKVTTFDPPVDAAGTIGTYGAAVTDSGVVAGYYIDGNIVCHSYLRTPDGKFTVFEAADAGTAPYGGYTAGSFVESANIEGGAILATGFVINNLAESHAWVRDARGKVTTFSVPGQVVVPGFDYGSDAKSSNVSGVVTGFWFDKNYAVHGFIRTP